MCISITVVLANVANNKDKEEKVGTMLRLLLLQRPTQQTHTVCSSVYVLPVTQCGFTFHTKIEPSHALICFITSILVVQIDHPGQNETFNSNKNVCIFIHSYYCVVILLVTNLLLLSINSVSFHLVPPQSHLNASLSLLLSLSISSACFLWLSFAFLHSCFLFLWFGFIPHPFADLSVVIPYDPSFFLLFTLSCTILSTCSFSQTMALGTFE